MYIIFETLSSNDPRLDPRMQNFSKFWHHSIAYINPADESNVIVSWLKHEVISEDVAKAAIFTTAYQGEIAVLANEDGTVANNMLTPTSGGDGFYKKAPYFLTEDDKRNAIKCMQASMRLFTEQHSTDTEKNASLLALINQLDPVDLDDAQMFMATYFDFDTAYTNGKSKSPEFQMNWVW